MFRFLSIAAVAATLLFVPAAGLGTNHAEVRPAAAIAPAAQKLAPQFGLDLAAGPANP